MKDNFSNQANFYAQFRPEYPTELYDFILQHVDNQQVAWDCATGNGQAAKVLANHFTKVYATDLSQKQLDNAVQKGNIFYSNQTAESTNFDDNTFDLITVAQAVHWFDFDKFYAEAKRVAKPNATIAVWGYGNVKFDDKKLDGQMWNFYNNRVGKYWNFERRHIEEEYRTLPFPFEEIESPKFSIVRKWQRHEFEGYLNSWSAVQNCKNTEGVNPVDDFMLDLSAVWGEFERKLLRFPLFLKLGKVVK
jgi:ubiquinone/menaquinone biosynthesis C-methylase UbiE